MSRRRKCLWAIVLLLGVSVGGGVTYAVRAVRSERASAPAPPASPKPSPLAKNFDFKGLLHSVLGPIRDPKSVISQNRDRRDEVGWSQTTCLGICIGKGTGHQGLLFEKLGDAVKAEFEAKGAKVDFLPGGVVYDTAKFWTGDFSVRHDGESYSGTARIWCVVDEGAPNFGQRITIIITIDERGPTPG